MTKPASRTRSQILDIFVAATGLPVIYFLFLPVVVYSTNLNSVGIAKATLVGTGAAIALVTSAGLLVLVLIPRLGKLVAGSASSLAVALFVIVLFPNRTGEMAGFSGDFLVAGDLVPLIKLLTLLVAGGWLARFRPAVFRAAAQLTLASALFVIFALGAFLDSASDNARKLTRAEESDFLRVGEGSNAIVIMLDGFTGYRMVEILREHPDIALELQGFTLYPKAIASALNTPAGSSAILTGSLKHAISMDDWRGRNTASLRDSFLADAVRNGWKASYISTLDTEDLGVETANEQSFFPRPTPTMGDRVREYFGFMEPCSMRVLPATLVLETWNQWRDRKEQRAGEAGTDMDVLNNLGTPGHKIPVAAKLAFARFVDTINIGGSQSRAIYFHSKISHSPWNFTEDGSFLEGAGSESSSLFVARSIVNLVRKLKAIDAFDRSLIIFVSDHGDIPVEDPTMGLGTGRGAVMPVSFNPLVLVKPPGAAGELKTSKMTVWLGDVSATVRGVFNLTAPGDQNPDTRSLAIPEDPGREIHIPIFFRPETASYHGPLKEWLRVDASGRFEDYTEAATEDPQFRLSRQSTITLRAGKDEFVTQLVKEGWHSGEGEQFASWIEINGRVAAKVGHSGIAILTDSTGRFQIRQFSEAGDAFAFISTIPEGANTFMAAVNVHSDFVMRLFGREIVADLEDERVCLVYASSTRGDPASILEVKNGDVSSVIQFR